MNGVEMDTYVAAGGPVAYCYGGGDDGGGSGGRGQATRLKVQHTPAAVMHTGVLVVVVATVASKVETCTEPLPSVLVSVRLTTVDVYDNAKVAGQDELPSHSQVGG